MGTYIVGKYFKYLIFLVRYKILYDKKKTNFNFENVRKRILSCLSCECKRTTRSDGHQRRNSLIHELITLNGTTTRCIVKNKKIKKIINYKISYETKIH